MKKSITALFSFIKVKKSPATLPKSFTVTAHTGCEGADDNTLESIRRGVTAGADIVEIDLNFLTDGTPILKHDAPKADDKNLPTMESAFELLSTLNVRMNIDVKSTANIPAVINLAQKYGVTDKIFFTGVEENAVSAIKSDAPGIPYYLNVSVNKNKNTDPLYLASLVGKVKDCGAIGINANFRNCSSELIDAFRKEQLLTSIWTANNKRAMYRCLRFNPDNITTRKPSVLREIIGK